MKLSGSKLSMMDVMNEGFKPLKRMPTEPTPLNNRPRSHSHRNSFNASTGEKEHIQFLWDNSAWGRMERAKGRVMERANTFVGPSAPHTTKQKDVAIAVVDPFSTGAHLAAQIAAAGYKVVKVLSIWDSPVAALVEQGLVVEYSATIQFNDIDPSEENSLAETIAALNDLPFEVLAVLPGAETGVELADKLSHRMKLRSNGEVGSMARRNKYMMGEKVREAGVRAVKQRMCRSVDEVRGFLVTLLPPGTSTEALLAGAVVELKCVVKPVQSAGSDDVFLCNSSEEAEVAFSRIQGKRNGLGLINDGALVQEFLAGKEFVIDKVSVDGVHKLAAIWQYDKRVVNGASFVYFGMKLVSSHSAKAQAMVAYSSQVLNALGIMQGPSHMEVMWIEDGGEGFPCLVEVGSRCHGGEGTWLNVAHECVGFTQVSLTMDAYTGAKFFNSIEDGNHYPLRKAGRDVDLVSRHSGLVRGFPGEAVLRALPSFRSMHWECKVGDFISKTVNCFTRPGCVQLVNESEEQAEKDLEAVHALEEMQLIDYSVICPTRPVMGAVVIVDPFSTGANLAAMAASWGYRVILVFSEVDSPVAKLVAEGVTMMPMILIQHNNRDMNQERALQETLAAIESQDGGDGADMSKCPVLAILPGAETGVELAETLAHRFGTRGNGNKHTHLRRSKFSMQNAVRDYGIRAVTQALCRSEEEVRAFWASLVAANNGGYCKCVVKPNESAGSDGVYLCETVEEALRAFSSLHGHFNGLGQVNDGALCQEFLVGTEFVVDGVSRDGVYKVTAIWEYDKRFANGANFVYFGMRLRSSLGEREKALVAYSAEVLKALHIMQGPSHMEIIMTATGPCLVEVGSRCHGGEATWSSVAEECVGYTQIDTTLNCYLRPDRFDALPATPTRLEKQGAEVFLVSRQSGVLMDIPGLTEIRNMASFRRMGMQTQAGKRICPTVDCFTRPGAIQMVHDMPGTLEADMARIREMELTDELFTLQGE